jgi:translation initiation factor IF-1
MQILDEKGHQLLCHICGKPARAFINLSVNCASSVPMNMQPVCDEHDPYAFDIVWKHNQTTGKTTAS